MEKVHHPRKKINLKELTETLQGKIERHFKAESTTDIPHKNSGSIEIPEHDTEENDIENFTASKLKEKQ